MADLVPWHASQIQLGSTLLAIETLEGAAREMEQHRLSIFQRATFSNVDSLGMQVRTKEQRLGRYGRQNGYFSSLSLKLGSLLRAGAAYQDLTG